VPAAPRLLFCSYHCCFDPSSGAALAGRDLLELLAARGWECGVYCGPRLDFEQPRPLLQVLGEQGLRPIVRCFPDRLPGFSLLQFALGGIPCYIFHPPATQAYQPPESDEGTPFLALLPAVLERFQPDILITYGGDWLAQGIRQTARSRGVRVVFWLRNLAYFHRQTFQTADAVLVPTAFVRTHYEQTLGLASTAIFSPIPWPRVQCVSVQGRYATFVNPSPDKGVFLFARLAVELGRRRPDIPLLMVEGRGKADWLRRTGLDFRGLTNLFVMPNTSDPRTFYAVSRLMLLPSLWQEPASRIPREASINGIPTLACRRGGIPEALGDSGFLFDVPDHYTPQAELVPTAAEVEPWIETIVRLWDDSAFYEVQRQRCLKAAEAYRPERIAAQYEAFLNSVTATAPRGTREAAGEPPWSPPVPIAPLTAAEIDHLLSEPRTPDAGNGDQ
jgi:glycosyltransferase involved in cell wall biosynthesis